MVTYPLKSLLIFLEQFCHPLPNELDHFAEQGPTLWLKKVDATKFFAHYRRNVRMSAVNQMWFLQKRF